MRIFSSTVTLAPILPSSSIVVVTSCRCGTLPTITGSSAKSAPASMGSVAFFAPEMRTSPSRATPPWICSLSTRRDFLRGQRFDRQRMNIAAHEIAERAVDDLMPSKAPFSGEFRRHDARGEMRVVVRFDVDLRAREPGADEFCDLLRSHSTEFTLEDHKLRAVMSSATSPLPSDSSALISSATVSYTHLRAHETPE